MKKGTCRFFNGVQHDKCKAGVEYRSLGQGKLPCITEYRGTDFAECDKYTEPSNEEVEKFDRVMRAASERMMKLIPFISRLKSEHKGKSWEGIETCPICSGKLHVTHASINGHVWGSCETENCVRWAE